MRETLSTIKVIYDYYCVAYKSRTSSLDCTLVSEKFYFRALRLFFFFNARRFFLILNIL